MPVVSLLGSQVPLDSRIEAAHRRADVRVLTTFEQLSAESSDLDVLVRGESTQQDVSACSLHDQRVGDRPSWGGTQLKTR